MTDRPTTDDLSVLVMLHTSVNLDSQSLRLTSLRYHTDQGLLHVTHQNSSEKGIRRTKLLLALTLNREYLSNSAPQLPSIAGDVIALRGRLDPQPEQRLLSTRQLVPELLIRHLTNLCCLRHGTQPLNADKPARWPH